MSTPVSFPLQLIHSELILVRVEIWCTFVAADFRCRSAHQLLGSTIRLPRALLPACLLQRAQNATKRRALICLSCSPVPHGKWRCANSGSRRHLQRRFSFLHIFHVLEPAWLLSQLTKRAVTQSHILQKTSERSIKSDTLHKRKIATIFVTQPSLIRCTSMVCSRFQ